MSASNYLEDKVLDHCLKGTAFTAPTNVYVSLHSADPGETGANEITAGANSYARQLATSSFAASSGGSKVSNADLTWLDMPAVTVTHFAIWDALTTGNCLFVGALGASKTTQAGDTFKILSGNLTVTCD